jgi:pentapeptide repeat protein
MTEWTDERRKALQNAVEKCSETVNRTMFSLLAVALFCLLTVFGSPDSRLIALEPSIKVPFTETLVSFVGFLVVAPLLLVVLTTYLHLFYGHFIRLHRERRVQELTETYLTLFSMDGWIPRLLSAAILYWLVPLILIVITWKAAVRVEWSLPVAVVTGWLIGALLCLRIVRRGPGKWRLRAVSLGFLAFLATTAPMVAALKIDREFERDEWERALNLHHAQLKGAWLPRARLSGASLWYADLQEANLNGTVFGNNAFLHSANLRGADLSATFSIKGILTKANLRDANLSGAHLHGVILTLADLSGAKLRPAIDIEPFEVGAGTPRFLNAELIGADLRWANLSGADLAEADLREALLAGAIMNGANLRGADLRDTKGLTCDQIASAQTDKSTKLPDTLHCADKK